jgi:hypothetical protein
VASGLRPVQRTRPRPAPSQRDEQRQHERVFELAVEWVELNVQLRAAAVYGLLASAPGRVAGIRERLDEVEDRLIEAVEELKR